MELPLNQSDFFSRAISPMREMAAYEAMWAEKGASFKKIADAFRQAPGAVPSELIPDQQITSFLESLKALFERTHLDRFGVRVHGAGEYPEKLRDAKNPIEILYYQGWWELVNTPCVAVVGARKVSEDGKSRTHKLVKLLVNDGYTIVSGLAEGVDAVAHETAIACGGQTIGVIGTPLSHVYPKSNSELQEKIRNDYLLISQVPFIRYEGQDYRSNRSFFPERNVTMSALTRATVIIEASDTSGTLYQARAALAQGRKLFILESCFNNPEISWPERFEKKGAIRVKEYADIERHLEDV